MLNIDTTFFAHIPNAGPRKPFNMQLLKGFLLALPFNEQLQPLFVIRKKGVFFSLPRHKKLLSFIRVVPTLTMAINLHLRSLFCDDAFTYTCAAQISRFVTARVEKRHGGV